ncbi:monofunctional biosynthetic peptidoglycan transglycosylase [Parasulfitobacter algicola]|uniref:Biosynthetic peptidoglycan transglycosylase n=1 Tax=Parasulfitobacter algicola TaxID=2614809 RepID=A0ABX2IMC7_9RHOB|nr:monofunctional biosynthetic peptidoglycan transglycosylase [Sulfitobacter algicola]NSX54033.1 monofunctional biosynthetic peptidoglycan transglycosylase [Sulfitobacter algicola]
MNELAGLRPVRKRKAKKKSIKAQKKPALLLRPFLWLWKWFLRGVFGVVALTLAVIFLYNFVNPPTTIYMNQEARRLGGIKHQWVSIDDIAPVMARSLVAAEDANYCLHWGFDMDAIRQVIAEGGNRGASTISQQVVKNAFLWHERSWTRKGLEALLTPVVEAVWSKRRIVEVYLNVAEFDEGVFGVQAASRHYFGVDAADLSATQSARLAAILPNPKRRSASRPSRFVQKRTSQIMSGASTIRADGRAACFSG